jgi:hypothetical protein
MYAVVAFYYREITTRPTGLTHLSPIKDAFAPARYSTLNIIVSCKKELSRSNIYVQVQYTGTYARSVPSSLIIANPYSNPYVIPCGRGPGGEGRTRRVVTYLLGTVVHTGTVPAGMRYERGNNIIIDVY